MIRGTTPTFTFNLPFDTSLIETAFITIRSKGVEVDKGIEDCILKEKTIETKLTQEETLKLPKDRRAEIQLRVKTTDGEALATDIYTIQVADILKEGVI